MEITFESLENSDLGAIVAYVADHPDETSSNKDLCRRLIDKWTQIIFEEEEAEEDAPVAHRDAGPLPEVTTMQMASGSRKSYFAKPPGQIRGVVAPRADTFAVTNEKAAVSRLKRRSSKR
ncbi:hypothetical protein GEMRC1_012802 [Eukaryota sp. GEM-RC1]